MRRIKFNHAVQPHRKTLPVLEKLFEDAYDRFKIYEHPYVRVYTAAAITGMYVTFYFSDLDIEAEHQYTVLRELFIVFAEKLNMFESKIY